MSFNDDINNDWGDDDKPSSTPNYEIAEVIDDYVPETNEHLPLFKYERVYVFKKNPNGIWEGEREGVYGKFPSKYLKLVDDKVKVTLNKKFK